MGGDGGTKNNSRADHVRMRAEIGGGRDARATAAAAARERASVTVCAVSRQPLRAPVVVDRLGQLFNKDALISYMLTGAGPLGSRAFPHVRRLARDTAAVGDLRVCAATREAVAEAGRFVVGWACGCVVAERAFEVVRGGAAADGGEGGEVECVACGTATELVRLGMTGEERGAVRARMLPRREEGKSGKRRRKGSAEEERAAKTARGGL